MSRATTSTGSRRFHGVRTHLRTTRSHTPRQFWTRIIAVEICQGLHTGIFGCGEVMWKRGGQDYLPSWSAGCWQDVYRQVDCSGPRAAVLPILCGRIDRRCRDQGASEDLCRVCPPTSILLAYTDEVIVPCRERSSRPSNASVQRTLLS